MNIYSKKRWNDTLVIGCAFVIAVSLLLFMMPYLVTAQDSTALSTLQLRAKSYVQQTIVLTSTNTYTYYFPLVFQNYYIPMWQLLGLEGSSVKDIAIDPSMSGVL